MKKVQNVAVLDSSEAEDDHTLQVLAKNFISLKFYSSNETAQDLFDWVVGSMKKIALRDFVANMRDNMYSEMNARPYKRETSTLQLSCDFDELLDELRSQGIPLSSLSFKKQRQEEYKAESVLRDLNQSLDLEITSYPIKDRVTQLIAATGVLLAQRCRVLDYDANSNLVRDCWLVQNRLDRFQYVPDADTSSQSSCIPLHVNHPRPPCPTLGHPPPPPLRLPQQQFGQLLCSTLELERKADELVNSNLDRTRKSIEVAVLIQDDTDLSGIIFSLACLRRLLFPYENIPSLIKEKNKGTPYSFVLKQIHMLREVVELPSQVDDSTLNLQDLTNQIYLHYCDNHRDICPLIRLPDTEDHFPIILASLEQQAPGDLGPINQWKAKITELAIIFGYFLGREERYAFPDYAQMNMFLIGTGIARGMFRNAPMQREPEIVENASVSPLRSCSVALPYRLANSPANSPPPAPGLTRALNSAMNGGQRM
ncbi:hypothetical protein Focb16_v009830 [Fusarium oxysporum f. sp. cubense]|uniref:Uncharacterized protein n=1 Tax=Fusarium oxysporum f. sp. cubense TaxID=61366 RepID=A0A559L3F1_FUSOC|nr:hypothetical protein Focb16_v009830 [Fusarium oxysporum f. sp. cubense]